MGQGPGLASGELGASQRAFGWCAAISCCTSGGLAGEALPPAAADAGDEWSADEADVAGCAHAPAAATVKTGAENEGGSLVPSFKVSAMVEEAAPLSEDFEANPSEPEPESVAMGVAPPDQQVLSPRQDDVDSAAERAVSPVTPSLDAEEAAPRASASSATSKRISTHAEATGRRADKMAVGKPYPRRPMMSKLGKPVWAKLEELFRLMDGDGNNAVTRDKAQQFFQGSFNNLSTSAMFNEVDDDGSGAITGDEFVRFWLQVRSAGYSDKDLLEEVEQLLDGGAWVDWMDGRNTTASQIRFPKRPLFSKLSSKAWKKCEQLFRKIDVEGKMAITPENGAAFFKGGFGNISSQAMFNEVDLNNHGRITAADWMIFWAQVRGSGYKDKNILEELDNVLEGGSWVDWKDGRSTA